MRVQREIFIFIFSFLRFFSDLWKLDRRFSSGLKAKLIHAATATHGHQNLGFCQTPRGKEFSYLCYFYPKGHLMAWDWLRGCERP